MTVAHHFVCTPFSFLRLTSWYLPLTSRLELSPALRLRFDEVLNLLLLYGPRAHFVTYGERVLIHTTQL